MLSPYQTAHSNTADVEGGFNFAVTLNVPAQEVFICHIEVDVFNI